MPEMIQTTIVGSDEEKAFEEVVVRVTRTAKVVSGGKRMSFSALAVVGNRSGKVGWGYGKAGEVPFAVEKAIRNAKRNIVVVPLAKNHTLPHTIEAKYKSTRVMIRPASTGTGLKCGAAVRAVLEYAGVKDALSKVYGSANSLNTVKAAFTALRMLRSKQVTEALRGVRTTGPTPAPYTGVLKQEPAQLPQTQPEHSPVRERGDRRGGRGGGGGDRRGGGRGPRRDVKGPRERAQEGQAPKKPEPPKEEPPKGDSEEKAKE
jgi:small subunit ribosomal protein S5